MTTSTGAWSTHQTYCAYGKRRTLSGTTTICGSGNGLPTTVNYTGQRLDGSGLMYYQARFYDPLVGVFVSPDSIVPDAGLVADYNRYMYVRGRVLNMVDPSGHCATTTHGEPDYNDGDCWAKVHTIEQMWNETGWWNRRWGSKENFRTQIASNAHLGTDFFANEILTFEQSKDGLSKREELRASTKPISQAAQDDPMCAGEAFCQSIVRGSERSVEYCTQKDCVAQSLDAIGTASAGLAYGCAAGVITAGCSLPAGAVSATAGVLGVGWTAYQYTQGKSDGGDLATAATTWWIGWKSTEGVGLAASIFQLVWDR